MRLQAFILVVLILCVSAKRRMRVRNPMPQPEGPCDMVQSFDQNFIYNYKYVAVTEHRDDAGGRRSDIRISCNVTISVPRRCTGKLRINECRVEEGTKNILGRMDFQLLPASPKFERDMGVNEMAFHFNRGQITKIFVDKQEKTSITNLKRGILSSLQAYNPDLPRVFEVGDVFEVPQISVYGQGVVEHKILAKLGAFPTDVEVVRDTSKIELPWEKRKWNFIHMKNEKQNPIFDAFKNYITVNSDKMWPKAKQSCKYTLVRRKLVSSARCEEIYPLNPVKPEFLRNMFNTDMLATTIRQEVDLLSSRRMTTSDRSRWSVVRFDEDSIMFENEWEEANMVSASGFDAKAAFLRLVQTPADDKSPALVSKLSRWMTTADQGELESVWSKCDEECSSKEKEAGRLLWVELLNSCLANDWCQIPHCGAEKSTSCEKAIETFLRSHTSESPEVKKACMASLESIYAPSEKIVDAALRICRAEDTVTPTCVRTLATVTKNYLQTCEIDCEASKPVANAKAFLVRQLKEDCETNDDAIAEVMATAVEGIGRFGRDGMYAEAVVLACATNPSAPAHVAIKALVAYGNVTGESLDTGAAGKLLTLFKNKKERFEIRIVCFHVLMKKNLQTEEVESVLATVMDKHEDSVLTEHCQEDLRTQLVLRGTSLCQYNSEVAQKCVDVIRKKRWEMEMSDKTFYYYTPVEKSFEMTRELSIPYFNTTTECTVKIDSVYEKSSSVIPMISKLTVMTKIEKRNVVLVEMTVDIASMKPVVDRIIGRDTFYAEMLGKVLKTPLHQLHGYSKQYRAMDALKMEGRYSYLSDVFDSRSPIYLKILGYDVSLDSLMGIDAIRRLTLGNIWKIVNAVESGFEHEALAIDQPFFMQHATPTSIGAPITSTIELSYILKSKLSLKANLRKILFTPNEKAIIKMAPEFHASGIISRTVLKQFSESSGTEIKLKLGHGSEIECDIDTTPQGINAVCIPKSGKTELFYLSGKRSIAGSGSIWHDGSVCVHYRMRDLCAIQYCLEPFSTTGFNYQLFVENEVGTEYRSAVSFITRVEDETKEIVKQIKTELNAENRANPDAKKVLWFSIVSYTPSRNELQCKVVNQWFKWRAVGDLKLPRQDDPTGLSASFKSSGMDDLRYKYNAAFTITSETDNKYAVDGEWKWESADNGLKGIKLNGLMEEVAEGKNTTRKVEFGLYNIQTKDEPLLISSLISNKAAEGLEGMPGFETRYSLYGSLLPYHQRYEFEMLTFGDEIHYEKILRASGHFKDQEREAQFYAKQIKGNWKRLENDVYDIAIHGVSNLFSFEYAARRDDKGDVVVRARSDFPEKGITLSEVVTGGEARSYNFKSFDRPIGSFVEWNYTDGTLEGDRDHEINFGYKLWSAEIRDYLYQAGLARYTKYRGCYGCHTLEVTHPKIELKSITKGSHEEKWLKLHYSLLDYLHLPPYISYYVIDNMENEYLEVGFKGKVIRKENERIEVEAALLRNRGSCVGDYHRARLDDGIAVACKVDISAIPLNVDFRLNATKIVYDKYVVALEWETMYANIGYSVEGEMTIEGRNNTFNFTSTYGTVGSYEYQDMLMWQSTYTNAEAYTVRYNVSGSLNRIYIPTGKAEEYKFTGTSSSIGFLGRNLDIKAFCPTDSEKVCVRFAVNKGENWIEYEKLVDEDKFDRIVVSDKGEKLNVEINMVDEIFWGVRAVTTTLEANRESYEFDVVTSIGNATLRYDENTGLAAYSAFETYWLEYRMVATANSTTARYEVDWDARQGGGAKIKSTSSINYVILYWYQPFSSKVVLGTAPESFKCGLQIPDFDFDFFYTTEESDFPTTYKYFFDADVKPYTVDLNELKVPVFGREIEVRDTKIGLEQREGSFYGVFAHDLDVSLSSACDGIEHLVIRGECALNREKVSVKMADADRSFVVDVEIDPDTPLTHHVQFILTSAAFKAELLWDMKYLNDQIITMAAKCDVGTICWKTKKISPVFTIDINNALGRTPKTGNFPHITANGVFNHDLALSFIPKKNKVALGTVIKGETTIISYVLQVGDYKFADVTSMITGCHQRFSPAPAFSFCVPNDLATNATFELSRFVRNEHSYTLKKVDGEWVFDLVNYLHAPSIAEKSIRFALNTRIESSPCMAEESWCVPRRIHFKDLECKVLPIHLSPGFFKPMKFDGLHIKHSDIVLYHSVINETNERGVVITARDAGTSVETYVSLSTKVADDNVASNFIAVREEWKLEHDIEVGYDPDTLGWQCHHKLDSPWIYSITTIDASSPFAITSCNTKTVATEGLVRNFDFSYLDHKIDCGVKLAVADSTGHSTHTYAWEPETLEWETVHTIQCPWMSMDAKGNGESSQIDTFDLNLKTLGTIGELKSRYADGNATCKCKLGALDVELSKEGNEYIFDLKSESYPWVNQSVSLNLVEQGSRLNWNTKHETQYHTCVSKFSSKGVEVKGQLLSCRMTNSGASAKVEYVTEGANRLCRIALKDERIGKISCLTTPMADELTEAHLECERHESETVTKFASLPVKMVDFPFLGDYVISDKALFAVRLAEFLYKAMVYDESKLSEEYQKEIACSNEAVCSDLARSTKTLYYLYLKELKRITDVKTYLYLTKPDIMEYAVAKATSFIPGSLAILPEYSSFGEHSVAATLKKILSGSEISLLHWSLSSAVEWRLSAKVTATNSILLKSDLSFPRFSWIDMSAAFLVEEKEGREFLKVVGNLHTWKYSGLFALEDGEIRITVDEQCAEACENDLVLRYNIAVELDGRHNLNLALLRDNSLQIMCDLLASTDDWSNTEIRCYEDVRREVLVGKTNVPELSRLGVLDFTDVDEILRDILHISSQEYRDKIYSSTRHIVSTVTTYVQGHYKIAQASSLIVQGLQYTAASYLHEIAKYTGAQEMYDIMYRFYESLTRLEPSFQDTYEEVLDYFSDVYATESSWKFARVVVAPLADTLGYVLDGRIVAGYEFRNGSLFLRTSASPGSFPIFSFESELEIERVSSGNVILRLTTANKFVTVRADARIDGPRFVVDKVRFGLPGAEKEFLEVRIVPNKVEGKPYVVQLFFTDREGQAYACRGTRRSFESKVIYMRCFITEGTELPPDLSSAKMIAYWDIDIVDVPHAARSGINGLWNVLVAVFQAIKVRSDDPASVDKALMEVYHVHDETIRTRLTRSVGETCRKWVEDFEQGLARGDENRIDNSESEETVLKSLAKKYKSYSYEILKSSLANGVKGQNDSSVSILDFGFIADLANFAYLYWTPLVRYSYSIAEYFEASGSLELEQCVTCNDAEEESQNLRLRTSMASAKYPIVDCDFTVELSNGGLVNTSLSGTFAWGWLESEVSGRGVALKRAKFGLVFDRENGVDVLYLPENVTFASAGLSFFFDVKDRFVCDAGYDVPLHADVRCYSYKTNIRGEEVATCEITPTKAWVVGGEVALDAIYGGAPRSYEVSRALEKVCEFKVAEFKDSISENLVWDFGFIGDYCRNLIKNTLKVHADLFRLPFSTWWKAVIDYHDWLWFELLPTLKNIRWSIFFRVYDDAMGVFLSSLDGLTLNANEAIMGSYRAGYAVNKFVYGILSRFYHAGEYEENVVNFYRNYNDYMNTWSNELFAADNCAFGMIHGADFEQAITMNNYMYYLPKEFKSCSYLLAGDVAEESLTIVMNKNDLIINMPKTSITISQGMRVFEGFVGGYGIEEVTLPYHSSEISCVRNEEVIYCNSPLVTVVVKSKSNIRTGFFVKISEIYCPSIRGLMGLGANASEVPRMLLMNDEIASSLEKFIDAYSIDKSCQIGKNLSEPTERHERCDALFERQQWKDSCPAKRQAFLKACHSGAQTPDEACRYVADFRAVCNVVGRLVKIAPECDLCEEKSEKKVSVEKVLVTVILSLSWKTKPTSLQETLNAVQAMANAHGHNYEVNFVTFGGRGDRFAPAMIGGMGRVDVPLSLPWTVPNLPFDGPAPLYQSIADAMSFALKKTSRTAGGIGKIFLFAMPEDVDFSILNSSTSALRMREDLIRSYLLAPNTCQRMGGKSRAIYGVRPLFTADSTSICRRSAFEVANAIAYPQAETITCACKLVNPYTGETTTNCRRVD